jgi:hypothetical protein
LIHKSVWDKHRKNNVLTISDKTNLPIKKNRENAENFLIIPCNEQPQPVMVHYNTEHTWNSRFGRSGEFAAKNAKSGEISSAAPNLTIR